MVIYTIFYNFNLFIYFANHGLFISRIGKIIHILVPVKEISWVLYLIQAVLAISGQLGQRVQLLFELPEQRHE
ncbi:MAG: hypothetical protein LBL75_02055 [Rickettsiales bacterium]|jgi:hypothetical protein|nr:hypothetical protein [Rickettsiales bacterium]